MFSYTLYKGRQREQFFYLPKERQLLFKVPGTGPSVPGFFCTLLCVTLSQNQF